LSSPPNPFSDPAYTTTELPSTVAPSRDENPVWTGWEVLSLACATVIAIFLFVIVVTLAAQRIFHPRVPWMEVAKFPGLIVLSQLLAYILVLVLMYLTVKSHGQDFWQAIRWNWPRTWSGYVLGGFVLALGLQAFAHLLPVPKHLPIDQFFQTTREAYLLSVFGVTLAPLLEELFFRGFLYPVLARRLGVIVGVFLTALTFALIHGAQLLFSWGPVLVIFLVGLALTIVRALTKSLAASLLVHVAYNATISLVMFVYTGGFRHLERLQQ